MKAHPLYRRLQAFDPVRRTGRVRRILPTHIEADGPNVPLGALCSVEARQGGEPITFQAEVVRIDPDGVVLSPFEDDLQTFSGALVTASTEITHVPVGKALLGRVVDSLGQPLDARGPLRADDFRPLNGETPGPLERRSPDRIFETGLRAIDGLLTLGAGQRIGVFAPSGAGKTTLMTQIARQAKADVAVICLVGERGQEVQTLWRQALSDGDRARTTLVAATSDQSAAMRVRAGLYALSIAEHWRARGKHVLLLLDSVTRLAMALRELGLAAGEPPTVRAYTPNVFAALPKLVERCGAITSGGAITAIMTVLSETEDVDDPVCEMMKSLLDGHIILSRALAETGQFPAIDVLRSISRQADALVPPEQTDQSHQIRHWLSVYDKSKTLIDTGIYAKGTSTDIDHAVERHADILHFLQQAKGERSTLGATAEAMVRLAGSGGRNAAR